MPWVGDSTFESQTIALFQSLFWWKYCPGPAMAAEKRAPYRPVFQSLFWWKYCPGKNFRRSSSLRVSWRFNPCSGGSIALGCGVPRRGCPMMWRFNPCSGGSIALGPLAPEPPPDCHKFQSLFWWKYCPGATVADEKPRGSSVSILVLVEVLPWDAFPAGLPLERLFVSILVLVEVLPWDLVRFGTGVVAFPLFQSLFWWKYCPGYRKRERPGQGHRFQSLFWWKYCPGKTHGLVFVLLHLGFNPCSGGSIALGSPLSISGCSTLSFNPCSGGSIALGLVYLNRLLSHPEVSILVLVEVLPWELFRPISIWCMDVSILVLVEVLPWVRLYAHQVKLSLVSILVLVEVLPWERSPRTNP